MEAHGAAEPSDDTPLEELVVDRLLSMIVPWEPVPAADSGLNAGSCDFHGDS